MTTHPIEELFLEYLEGTLPHDQCLNVEAALATDPQLRQSLEQYRALIALEQAVASDARAAHPGFSVRVMEAVEEQQSGFFRRFCMALAPAQRMIGTSIVLLIALVVVFQQQDQVNVLETAPSPETETALKTSPLSGTGPGEHAQEAKEEVPASAPVKSQSSGKELRDAIPAPAEIQASAPLPGQNQEGALTDNKNQIIAAPDTGREAEESTSQAAPARSAQKDRADHSTADDLFVRSNPARNLSLRDMLSATADAAPGVTGSVRRSSITSGERYGTWEESPRFDVSRDPVSTFSIDVDTASYTNTRRFLTSGHLPPEDAVRIEEYVNYFDYDYPAQTERPFSVHYEIAPSPFDSARHLLKIGIRARDAKVRDLPWNLVFLIDVSGSMVDLNKLSLVQSGLKVLVNAMRPEDRIAIVTYAGTTGVALESTSVREKQKILDVIDSLGAGGSTYGSGGIQLAYQVAEKNFKKDGINRVVLATDGDFNVGLSSHGELIKLIEQKRKSGVSLTTLGVGMGNLQDHMLEQLANKGNGNYFYLDSFQEAQRTLEQRIAGTMEMVAKDVKLQIEFNPRQVVQYRLIGYDNRKLAREDFTDDSVDAGEIGVGHTVTALYEIVLAGSEEAKRLATEYRYSENAPVAATNGSEETGGELAFLKIRAKVPHGTESVETRFPIEKNRVKSDWKAASEDFRFAAAVTWFGEILRNSKFAGSATLTEVRTLAEGALGKDSNGDRREFVKLVKTAEALKR